MDTPTNVHRINHYIRSGRARYILLAVVASMIAIRIALPYVVKSYINEVLAEIPGYTGSVADVDMLLWRGAYVIKGMIIQKSAANVPTPYFSCPESDLSVEWGAILHGSIVDKMRFVEPRMIFIGGSTEAESQDGRGGYPGLCWIALWRQCRPLFQV